MSSLPQLTRQQRTEVVRTHLACADFGPSDSYQQWWTPSTLLAQLAMRRRHSVPDFVEKSRARVRRELGLD